MKHCRNFIKIALLAEIYIIFTVLCSLLSKIFAEYESVILSVWYFMTLAVWLVFAVIFVSLTVKIKRFDKHKYKRRIIKRKE